MNKCWKDLGMKFNPSVSAVVCKEKYNFLLKVYRDKVSQMKKSGEGAVNWKYMEVFHDTYPRKDAGLMKEVDDLGVSDDGNNTDSYIEESTIREKRNNDENISKDVDNNSSQNNLYTECNEHHADEESLTSFNDIKGDKFTSGMNKRKNKSKKTLQEFQKEALELYIEDKRIKRNSTLNNNDISERIDAVENKMDSILDILKSLSSKNESHSEKRGCKNN